MRKISKIDQIKFFCAILLPIPTGFLTRCFKDPTQRLYTILLTGAGFQFFLYGTSIFIPWLELLLVYFVIPFLNRKLAGWIITAFALVFLSLVHIERMITDYGGWHLDISTTVMLQCIHLSTFAWDYTDGAADPATLTEEQKKNAIKNYPGIIEFFAAAVCPTQAFTGPACNFQDFIDFVNLRGDFAAIPSGTRACLKR